MSLRVDRVQLEIIINNDQARKQLRVLDEEMRQLQRDLKKIPEGTEEWIRKNERLNSVKSQYDNVKREIGLTGMTLKELTAHQKELNMVLLHMNPNVAQYKMLQKELAETSARIRELRTGAQTASFSMNGLADQFNRYQALGMVVVAAIAGIGYTIANFIKGAGELSDSLADIQKTTGLTAREVEELNSQLGKIDTRTSRAELRQMAVVAGQLGIAKNQVFDFVASIDKLNVALGDEITGGAEEVARIMGTLRNVLTDMKTNEVDQDMLRIGNALNELGKAGFATSPVVADFANRIGGIGISLGLTSDEVLGLSATLQELNVNTERGGTAVIRILQKMTTNTGEFSRIAGMPVKDFTELVNTDLMGALMQVVEGSRRGGQSATLLAGIIKDLEVQGAGASEVFAKLGGNTEMLKEKIDLAGSSLAGTDSIMTEFNIKNSNLGATLDKLRKDFYSLIMLKGVQDFFKNLVFGAVQAVQWLKNLPEFIEKYKIVLIAATGATLAWIAAKTRGVQVTLWNNLTLKEGILLKIKDAVVTKAQAVAEELRTIWTGKGTVATKLATTAQYAWNAAVSANPIGLIITGITALVAGIKAYDKYNGETLRLENEKQQAIQRLDASYKTLDSTYEQLSGQVRNFSKLSVQEKKDLLEKIDLILKQAEAELILQQAKQKDIEKENTRATTWEKIWNYVVSGGNMAVASVYNFTDAVENGQEAAGQMDEGIQNLSKTIENLRSQKVDVTNILNAEKIGDAIGTGTMEELEEKLRNYQTALRNTSRDTEEFIRIQGKIKSVNKELARLQPQGELSSSDLKKQRSLVEEYKSILESISQFESKQIEEKLSRYSREVIEVERKYDQEITKARKFLQESKDLKPAEQQQVKSSIDNLETEKNQAVKYTLMQQEEVFTKEMITLRNKLKQAQLAPYQQEIVEINRVYEEKIRLVNEQCQAISSYYDKEISEASGNTEKIQKLEEEKKQAIQTNLDIIATYEELRNEEQAAVRLKQEKELQEEMKKIRAGITNYRLSEEEREILAIDEKYAKLRVLAENNADQIARIEKLHTDEINEYKRAKAIETAQQIAQFLSTQAQLLSDTLFTIDDNRRQADTDAQLAALDKQKQKELSNKNLTGEQKQAIEDRYRKKEATIKTKAWKDQQKAAETQAIVNGALAVVNILATMPWADFGVAHAIAIAASIASTIAQVAVIRSQKMPQFHEGGYTGDGDPDEPAGVVHKGEYVVPAEQLKNKEVTRLVEIIEARRKGKEFRQGGYTEQVEVETGDYWLPRITIIPKFNVPEIIQAIRQAPLQAQSELLQRQTRKIISQLNLPELIRTQKQEKPQPADERLIRSLDGLDKRMQVMDDLNATLKAGIRSRIVYTEWDEVQQGIEEMIADSGA
ncbi:MAG: phage tail tape measure protein [Bacteroidales bacterium]